METVHEVATIAAQPIAALSIAAMATSMFSRGPRRHAYTIGAMAVAALLGIALASWVVHPAAAICLAVLWTYIWRSPRKSWRPLARGVVGIAVFGLLGAGWVVFPASWLLAIWLLSRGPRLMFGGGCGGKKIDTDEVTPKVRLDKQPRDGTSQASKATVASTAEEGPDLYALAHDIRVPQDCRAQLVELRDRCRRTASYLVERGLGEGRLAHTVHQIQHDFAPGAVHAYLQLPPTMANVAPLEDGKTGHQLLTEQLDLLIKGVDDVMSEATTIGGASLKASYRFITDKFGKKPDDLSL